MRGLKTLLGTTALLAGLALAPAAHAQIVVGIGVPPVCSYGYYDYAPYACAPYGILRAGVLLQRHLPGHGPMGRLGLWPRLGRPSLRRRRRRKLSRRRRSHGQSQQFCPRWRRSRRYGDSGARRRSVHGPWQRSGIPFQRSATQRRSSHSLHASAPAPRAAASHASAPQPRARSAPVAAVAAAKPAAAAVEDMPAVVEDMPAVAADASNL